MSPFTVHPIGHARTPFLEKRDAPRQGTLSHAVGTIELVAGMNLEHAVEDLAGWQYIWLVYWFDRVEGWRPKVRPPRSTKRRGVLSTRSPHRPNPIGMTVAELHAVDGLTLHVARIDLLDGTPILDIKPYVPYSDAITTARCGWLDEEAAVAATRGPATAPPTLDPHDVYRVAFSERAEAELAFVEQRTGLALRDKVVANLSESPAPRAYRRIRRREHDSVIAIKEWRVVFVVDVESGREVRVTRVESGFRDEEIDAAAGRNAVHAEFRDRFGRDT